MPSGDSSSALTTSMYPVPEPMLENLVSVASQDVMAWRENVMPLPTIPRSVVVDTINSDNLSSLVVSQRRLGSRVVFGPIPYQLATGLARLAQESPGVKRWSLYLGANLVRGLLDGTPQPNYIGWIDRFQRQVTSSSVVQTLDATELEGRLSCLEDLAYYTSMLLDSRASYAILKQCLPFFLQLATKLPNLWTAESAISIHHVLNTEVLSYEIRKFVLWDTVMATAFGTAPLLHYDTTLLDPPPRTERIRILERSYGCPKDIVSIIAKVNSARVSRWLKPTDSQCEEWTGVEARLKEWAPTLDPDLSTNVVARFAVQESWRQAAYIYLYMGMCRVDSSDPRVESAVRQIVRMAKTIEHGSSLEIHLCMPCLIAGIASRLEHHRELMRKKIAISRDENVWCIRGADFVPVLDHLWHGAGVGGVGVTWEDYMTARCIMLPIEG
ncbi:Fungal specific transcription factor domain [Ceratobasidium sp. AG-Ba]|nr:Fungal specific transcription factor domain [Ceratobasidium sp. AG-Ba]